MQSLTAIYLFEAEILYVGLLKRHIRPSPLEYNLTYDKPKACLNSNENKN